MKWTELNMKERHKFIKIAVQCGVYDLDTIHSLYDKGEKEYDAGEEMNTPVTIPTNHNRQPIDVSVALNEIREKQIAKYDSKEDVMSQIKALTDKLQEDFIKQKTMEWINPSRYANNAADIRRTIPVALSHTFTRTFQTGGTISPTDPPYSWIKADEEAVKPLNQRISHPYKVRATEGQHIVLADF